MNQYLSKSLVICTMVLVYAKDEKGIEAPKDTYLYQAALMYKSDFVCGASVISEHCLLTAAHCVKVIDIASEASVLLGTVNLKGKDGVEYKVEKLIAHKYYNKTYEHAHDIALIHVTQTITFNDKIQPVKIPKYGYEIYSEDTIAVFAGWGTDTNSTDPSSKLQDTFLQILNLRECAKDWKEKRNRVILHTELCATSVDSSTFVTRGDSGGPLVYNNTQIGILSFAWQGLPDVFTRVSNYRRWIEKYMV